MMINIVGINFDSYPLLKSIEKYCTMNYIDLRYINFLTKGSISVLDSINCSIVIYVEIEPISDTVPFIRIVDGVDGRTIAAAFKKLVKEFKDPEPVQVVAPIEVLLPSVPDKCLPWEDEPGNITVTDVVEMSNGDKVLKTLAGVELKFNDKILYLPKEDFDKFMKVKELTEELGYSIYEVVTKD